MCFVSKGKIIIFCNFDFFTFFDMMYAILYKTMIFDNQFNVQEVQTLPKQSQTISVVIAKPTRVCNADCQYCSSPPLEEMGNAWEPEWNFEKFKFYFDKIYPAMISGAYWIWHGGEPMLMGPDFYLKCHEYVQEKIKQEGRVVYFSMQSNLLGYSTQKWYKVFAEVFQGSISTSFDPDETQRTIKGNAKTYSRVFKRVLKNILDDGFRPMVIGVYSEETAHFMEKMYDWSCSLGEQAFPLRFNYCHPTGRLEHDGEAISPITYADNLIKMYDRWLEDAPGFTITPLDQMFKKVIGMDGEGHCPWTKKCGGRFLEIEPNGEVYNCSEFADLGNKYCFGNLNDNMTVTQLLNSRPALLIKRRALQLPNSCSQCEHFNDCEGGCMRDAALYEHGLYGKFHYCESWKMVFTRIKESILQGKADKIIKQYGLEAEKVKNYVLQNIQSYFFFSSQELSVIKNQGVKNKYGFGDNYFNLPQSNYNLVGQYKENENSEAIFNDPEISQLSQINKKLKSIKLIVQA